MGVSNFSEKYVSIPAMTPENTCYFPEVGKSLWCAGLVNNRNDRPTLFSRRGDVLLVDFR